MSVRKLEVPHSSESRRVADIESDYSYESIFEHLNAASKRLSKKMKMIEQEERRSWENARVRMMK